MLRSTILLAVYCLGTPVAANVEKVIFSAPARTETFDLLSGLNLDVLSADHQSSLRQRLKVAFPTTTQPRGLQYWYLVDALEANRRYEVRICWPATQPTSFQLREYNLSEVFSDTELSASVISFSDARKARGEAAVALVPRPDHQSARSHLLLQIHAAADYYTTNKTLMKLPGLVDVDIILDPYILGFLPKSLLPTGLYILLIAIGSWYLSYYIWQWLRDLSQESETTRRSDHDVKQHND